MNEFGFLRVAACAPALKVADVDFNTKEIIYQIEKAEKDNIKILAFPELALCGATCGDLFFQEALKAACANGLSKIIEASVYADMVIILGYPAEIDGKLYNTAVIISAGKILGIVPKTNPDFVLEQRWFTFSPHLDTQITLLGQDVPFGNNTVFTYREVCFGVEVGLNKGNVFTPSLAYLACGANLIFNIGADNDVLGKANIRSQDILAQSQKGVCGYIYAGAGAGESSSDKVHAGHLIIAECGKMLACDPLPSFESKRVTADIDIKSIIATKQKIYNVTPYQVSLAKVPFNIKNSQKDILRKISKTPFIPASDKWQEHCSEVLSLQALGLAKRLNHLNKIGVVIGVSGGLDSTLALLVCVRAFRFIGAPLKNITAVTMPGLGTSKQSYNTSIQLSKNLGVSLRDIDISSAVHSHFADIGHSVDNMDITYENAQARERTQVLMDLANSLSAIVVGTSDASELALGWCTYGGDQMSMYQVNGSIPKTLIVSLIEYEQKNTKDKELAEILQKVLNAPISPELLPTDKQGEIVQKTENVIGDYILHDFFLYHFLHYGASPSKLLMLAKTAFGNDYDTDVLASTLKIFLSRFISNQFKRNSMPDGADVTGWGLSPRYSLFMPSDAVNDVLLRQLDE